MNNERDGHEVWFQRYYEDEFELWAFTEGYLEASQECNLLMEKDHVYAVKLMRVTSVQALSLTKEND